jgi:hypothetical protein
VLLDTWIEDVYVYDFVEFGFNVFDTLSRDIATNALDFTLYNDTDKNTPVLLTDAPSPLKISFPIYENYNLTLMQEEYLNLSPLRPSDVEDRLELLAFNQVNCTFLDTDTFSLEGCVFG